MSQVKLNAAAPNFRLKDFEGNEVSLSDFRGEKHVVLVFNRGFKWPYCRAHMAQLRRDYDRFVEKDTEVLVVGPEGVEAFQQYWAEHNLPYPGLPDPKHTVLKKYGQEIKLFKFGRMPAQVIVDKEGTARFVHYGKDMQDIPENDEILGLLSEISGENAGD